MLQIIEKTRDPLTAEEVRSLLYELAADAHLASLAIQSDEDFDNNDTLLSLNSLLHRWKDRLYDVASGHTSDRLSKLEPNEVAS